MDKNKQTQSDKNEFSDKLGQIANMETGLSGIESDRMAFVAGFEAGTDVFSAFDSQDGKRNSGKSGKSGGCSCGCGCGADKNKSDLAHTLAEAGADMDKVYDMEVVYDHEGAESGCGAGCKKNLSQGKTNVEASEDMMTDINIGMGADTEAADDSNFYFNDSFPATKGMEAGADENFSFDSDNGVTENTPYKDMAKYKMIPDMDESDEVTNTQGS